ncbi:transglutaminase family protein [Marivibrio halodurans]|uniref:Transglutaminase family protein n=1 Tax=Marivibrio halodurans TaxID=2039722 RepID=A0A8J7S890_9PROT|nr:transglutaminase-like domain-containing protein [Marivibrio halodurans]MBP5858684.1 transglutaminase family protein [Marivibrio halodurans]
MTLADTETDITARQILRDIGRSRDARLPLGLGALALAAGEAPAARLDTYRAHIERMTADVREIVGDAPAGSLPVAEACDAIAHVLYGLHGYQGDHETYDDLQNANLIRVIDRRKGLPVALGILYITLARAVGIDAVGLDFPGHFLVRVDSGGERRVIDPFDGGAPRDAASLRGMLKTTLGADAELSQRHYEPAADKDVLLRLQNNLKLRLIQRQQVDRAAEIVDGMLTIAPERATLWREAGLLNAHIGNHRTAIAALETYIERETREAQRREAAELLAELRQKTN